MFAVYNRRCMQKKNQELVYYIPIDDIDLKMMRKFGRVLVGLLKFGRVISDCQLDLVTFSVNFLSTYV